MPSLSQDLASRGTPLEYWFIKVHTDGLAFLVDLIVRRPIAQAEVRVSLWVRGKGRVARTYAPSWHAAADIAVSESRLDERRCVGLVEDVEWDLGYDVQAGRAAPRVPGVSRLHPFDLELISRPRTVYNGHVTVAGERFGVADAPGSVTHYWGRRLGDRWRWISANAFDGGDTTIEAVVFTGRLWGRRPAVTTSYLWRYQGGREQMVISPWNGLITVSGTHHDYRLAARSPGGTTRLRCQAPSHLYNDLGEGIHQTLHGSCAVAGDGLVDSRAGLEYRLGSRERQLDEVVRRSATT
jgi:hypothetical protein